MSAPNVFVKVGTTMAKVHPENVDSIRLQLTRASRVPTAKQVQASAMRRKDPRKYPGFAEGATTESYVIAYYAANADRLGPYAFSGKVRSELATQMVVDFFEQLSTNPQFAQADEAIEEVLA